MRVQIEDVYLNRLKNWSEDQYYPRGFALRARAQLEALVCEGTLTDDRKKSFQQALPEVLRALLSTCSPRISFSLVHSLECSYYGGRGEQVHCCARLPWLTLSFIYSPCLLVEKNGWRTREGGRVSEIEFTVNPPQHPEEIEVQRIR